MSELPLSILFPIMAFLAALPVSLVHLAQRAKAIVFSRLSFSTENKPRGNCGNRDEEIQYIGLVTHDRQNEQGQCTRAHKEKKSPNSWNQVHGLKKGAQTLRPW